MDKLDRFLLKELQEIAKQLGIEYKNGIKKSELKELIEKDIEEKEGLDIAWGSLEVLPDGYGFLRNTSVEKDVYVSASQVRKFKLRTEDIVVGEVRILFGISMPIFKYLLTSNVPPEAITIMRATFACMMFWLVSFFMPKEKVLPKDLITLLVCALCGVGINQWLFVVGLKSSSPVNASIIATTVPIFVLLLAAIILKEPITTKKSFGVFMGLSGGLLLVFSSTHTVNSTNSLRGDIFDYQQFDVLYLFGIIQTAISTLFVSYNNEMDVSIFGTDLGSVLHQMRTICSYFP